MDSKRLTVLFSVTGAAVLYGCYWLWRRRRCSGLSPSKILLVSTCQEWESAYEKILRDIKTCKVLGFDCEWISLGQRGARPVSLLQLATPSGLCVLVRMLELDEVPVTLRDLLANRSILKVGVGCLGDSRKLMKDHAILVRGCVDLRHLAVRARQKTTGFGLKALSSAVIDVDIDKDILIRASNWELNPLDPKQIQYAAMDALVGVKIFLVFINRKLKCAENKLQDPILEESDWVKALSMCQGIVDTNFSHQKYRNQCNTSSRRNVLPNGAGGSSGTPKKSHGYTHRKRPLYHNCQLRAPDGQLLCTCDVKKAEWYVEKGLGEKVGDDPLTIKLNFEPSGRPMDDKNYYLQDKKNICVVCGSADSYIRKNIVPQDYRKHFPSLLKEHKSHDVVLMCSSCHQHSTLLDQDLKASLASQCGAPLSAGSGTKFTVDRELQQVKSAARALLNKTANIPRERLEELTEVVKSYYGVPVLSELLLMEASEIDFKMYNGAYVPHGQKVVRYFVENDGLIAFERMWRQHFLDTMKPQYLPDLWSVDHSHGELAEMDQSLRTAINYGH